MSAPRGMALINALIVVAALSAVAVALLSRGDQARERLAAQGTADQARLHLAAAPPLVMALLADVADPDAPVHLDQPWAEPRRDMQIDRAELDWDIADLQGRFNVNWLTAPEDWGSAPRTALIRLAATQDVPREQAARIGDALTPGANRAGLWDTAAPPDGPILDIDELRDIDGVADSELDALAPFLAALPPEARLNPNTMAPVLLAAFLGIDPDLAAELLEPREAEPFTDAANFLGRVLEPLGTEALEAIPEGLIGAGSDWFELRVAVRLDNARHGRKLILHRTEPEGDIRVVLSLPEAE